jgi:hypothetical protein
MEFLQYLSNPYAVIGLIVFVAASALGVRANAARRSDQTWSAPLFFGLALVGLATTVAIAWIDMKKTTESAQSGPADTIKAEGGSNVVTDVDASDRSTITIHQGGQP